MFPKNNTEKSEARFKNLFKSFGKNNYENSPTFLSLEIQ
ncbi:Conserved hypothetical protein [Clostridium acetobutylicum EA 2018]|uniref:Uncharacterized protein n=1 Tax=Clostridium acetobutylicum (strain ATCC 824 / DSM 792 / JCM 1419 / IAM 19013 / LMG 5710 / NBRC 13948 / NRRL B-527 / VKM B-1787 / 2291 / W) TaxID=272562 RepID=Q97DJ8_CLOAB|nr:Hypothetical protein CA_C3479 [Clostridium acetobutylicum ATCC 824]ADZ22520.1 Conserved hypothetical protein [Clostridium acetobutylicum EA 2018]AEI32875.1 hypothetical protein SMB_G3517 [Clostridium acetobutylicum DSM 1731]AWV80924.1 hypothetical protein DK921_12600 [Clostridium acetobutylicum]PSM05512.1 hypothetical protein C7T89_12600 [Clostridium sp. NJ4]